MQAVDAVLRQWQEGKAKSRVVTIAHAEAMKESCREVLGTLLTRAQELNFRLAVVLTGTADQEILLKQPELREYTHASCPAPPDLPRIPGLCSGPVRRTRLRKLAVAACPRAQNAR